MSIELKRASRKTRSGRMFLAAAKVTVALLVLFVASSGSAAVGRTLDGDGRGRPLGEVLRPDGTLALPPGFRGSLDARGWQLASGHDEAPRFAPRVTTAEGQWADIFSPPGISGVVNALAVDGNGNLYAGGAFTTAGGVSAYNIAMWDGSDWSALGAGIGGGYYPYPAVYSLAVDGDGNLYAGGYFTTAGGVSANHIARWDGFNWSALGSGMGGGFDYPGFLGVNALAVDSDGTLYAGGTFTTAGGVEANRIAMWDGSSWSALGSGMGGGCLGRFYCPRVFALAVDGDGKLYAGGFFTTAGGVSANYIAKWNGAKWSPLGDGMSNDVRALAVDGDGNLYAGGWFTTAGGVDVNNIARWDGANWSGLGSGMSGVYALAVDDNGTLYAAGGSFTTAGGVSANHIAKWDGANWSALGGGINGNVSALVVDGDRTLYAGGTFGTAGAVSATNIARWDGVNWSALGSGSGMSDPVYALAVDGNGNLYAGGAFATAGGVSANRIARWNGSDWSALGRGMGGDDPYVYALAVDGDGTLYAGGRFTTAGGVSANNIARWDGSRWSALGGGTDYDVSALAVDDDGALYAGGSFTTAGGASANCIARWDGVNWSALGSGMNYPVYTIAVDDNGTLYAGGLFTSAGGVSANRIARWDGAKWSALGGGMGYLGYAVVYALAVDGDGNLYAGGDFSTAGGVTVNGIAKWDGSSWSALGSGMGGGDYQQVSALAVNGDSTLYAGGIFTTAGGVSANNVARWDGSSWSALGGGTAGNVSALAVDGDGALYAGGYFTTAGGKSSAYIALWITAPYAAFSGSPKSGIAPLTVHFTNHSLGNFNSCAWDFGNGDTSTNCNNPSHHYTEPGVYPVSLTVSGPAGSNTRTKAKYITVNEYGSRLPIIMIGK